MMGSWKIYCFSVISCALICELLRKIISDSRRKELLHLICGLVLTIHLLQPLSNIKPEIFLPQSNQSSQEADHYIRAGKKAARNAQAESIRTSCEAYILDKAKAFGTDIRIRITLDTDLLPAFATIEGNTSLQARSQLEKILANDLGIQKENQEWIWNRENNSS